MTTTETDKSEPFTIERYFPSARYDWEIDDLNGVRTTVQEAARRARDAGKADQFRASISVSLRKRKSRHKPEPSQPATWA